MTRAEAGDLMVQLRDDGYDVLAYDVGVNDVPNWLVEVRGLLAPQEKR